MRSGEAEPGGRRHGFSSPDLRRRCLDLSGETAAAESNPFADRPRRRSTRTLAFCFVSLSPIGILDRATRTGFLTLLPFVLSAKGASLPAIGTALTLVFAGGATVSSSAACSRRSARRRAAHGHTHRGRQAARHRRAAALGRRRRFSACPP